MPRSYDETKEMFNQLTAPADGGGMLESLQRELGLVGMPGYITAVADLRSAIDRLEDHLRPCENCRNPTCPGTEPHLAIMRGYAEGPVIRAKTYLEELYDAVCHVAHELLECECEACKVKKLTDNAPYN